MVKIVWDEKGWEDIRAYCPKGDPRVAKCIHCAPEEAPCVKGNPEVFVECVKGVICVEGGSYEDVRHCPYDALVFRRRLLKCDLCIRDGYPLCVRNSDHVKIVLEERDMEEVGKNIGWLLLSEGDYILPFLPPLPWEARLYALLLRYYERMRGEYSVEEVMDILAEDRGVPPFTVKRVLDIFRISNQQGGPFSLIEGDEVEEIAVIDLKRPVKVFIRGRGWVDTNLVIWSEDYFLQLVNSAGDILGRRISRSEPRVNAVLPDGSRMHAVIPPLSPSYSLTLRRFTRKPLTMSYLIESGMITPEQAALLWKAVDEEMNILIAGNTGSGKTTLLNALFGFVPLDERIVIVEETPEINIPHPHTVRMIVIPGTSMKDLIRDTLRMRPDRVIVGEIRREDEVEAFMDTVLAGQGRGSYATFHGRSSEEVRRRLLSMGVSGEDLGYIDVIVVTRRRGGGSNTVRRVEEVVSTLEPEEWRVRFLRKNPVYDMEEFVEVYTHAKQS